MAGKRKQGTANNVAADMDKRDLQGPPGTEKEPDTPKRKSMKQASFRLEATDFDILVEHFKDEGLLLSQGLRKVIRKYMKDSSLL